MPIQPSSAHPAQHCPVFLTTQSMPLCPTLPGGDNESPRVSCCKCFYLSPTLLSILILKSSHETSYIWITYCRKILARTKLLVTHPKTHVNSAKKVDYFKATGKRRHVKLGMEINAWNPSTGDAKARGWWAKSQSGLQRETLAQITMMMMIDYVDFVLFIS